MQVEEVERSLSKKILGIAYLLLFTVGPLYWFAHVTQQLITDIVEQSDLIVFDKGSMYLLGGGLCLGFLTFIFITDTMKKELSKGFYKKATPVFIFFLGSVLVVPQVADFSVHRHIERINYVYCEDQSIHQPHISIYVFATDLATCTTYRSEDREKTGSEAKAENPRPRRTNPRHPQIY